MDTLRDIAAALVILMIIFGILKCTQARPEVAKPTREYPTWCHIARDISASGPCNKIPGLWWAT